MHERSYRRFQFGQVAEAAQRDERLQFELDTMAGEGLEVVMADQPTNGGRQVLHLTSHLPTSPSQMLREFYTEVA